MSKQVENKIREILFDFIGDEAMRIDSKKGFWIKELDRNSTGARKKQKAFYIAIHGVFGEEIDWRDWEDIVSIEDLVKALTVGKLSESQKADRLKRDYELSLKAIKWFTIIAVPLIVFVVIYEGWIQLCVIMAFYLLGIVGPCATIREYKRKGHQL